MEGVDLVYALAVVQTRLTGALVRVDVAEDALVPLNPTHTGKSKISKKTTLPSLSLPTILFPSPRYINPQSYLACRCSGTLRSGPDRSHHYGRDWTCIH